MENKLRKLIHIGFAVKNMEKTIENMRKVYGLEPDRMVQMDGAQGRKFRGKDANFVIRIVFYRFANIELEFISPISGDSSYSEFLEKHGDGMQHLCFDVADLDGAKEDLHNNGFELIQEGVTTRNVPGLCFAYFDAADSLGHVIEVVNFAKFDK